MQAIEQDKTTHALRKRKRMLVCVASYLPGYKSGGPIRSITNVVAHLSDRFDFYVVTRDRDVADAQRYPQVTADRWCEVGNAQVLYCSSIGPSILCRAFREAQPDLVYLNSFQDAFTRLMVTLRRVGKFGDTPMLLAPRGEFASAAMRIKRPKKTLYRHASRLLGFHENLSWHATNASEKRDVLEIAPARRLIPDSVYVARNISESLALSAPHVKKEPGSVKFAVVARMSEMKNLGFLMEILSGIRGRVELNLFGPVGMPDVRYWKGCMSQIEKLPENVKVKYEGPVDNSLVPQVLHDHHFFVLPTKGENFCHAAVESFVNGTPAVISDQTPWIELSKAHAGFDIPLDDRARWTTALQACIDMDQTAYASYLNGAEKFGRQFSNEAAVSEHVAMFEAAMKVHTAPL
ncbi:MAG TPA: glycosyltransferase [Terracidiphilus sp.]|nr:glycosyltransferase [Terracidiphilus sp.]